MDAQLQSWRGPCQVANDRRMPRPRALYQSRRRWTISDARAALAALKASGLSVEAFALREGIHVERLCRWRRRLSDRGPTGELPPEFVELHPTRAEPIEIVLRSGRVLRISTAIDGSALERLVAILERIEPC